MPDPYEALRKARAIEPEPGLLEQAIALLVGGLGLSGVPVPTATGPARAMGDTRASRLGEALAMLAGVPVAGTVRNGIKAYHGSPHDFDKFSLAKIGTGEGAQAYGHGLYFAGNENTARAYRERLGGKYAVGAAPPIPPNASGHAAIDFKIDLEQLLGVVKSAPQSDMIPYLKDKLERRAQWWKQEATNYSGGSAVDDMNALVAWYENHLRPNLDQLTPQAIRPGGHMYEVNINADPETLLDWDKPLSQQPTIVQKANAAGIKTQIPVDWPNPPRGEHLAVAARDVAGNERAAAEALKQAGIPGLKYLDQGSRAAGEGSRNYVIFDADLVEIMRKYGLLPPLAAGLAGKSDAR